MAELTKEQLLEKKALLEKRKELLSRKAELTDSQPQEAPAPEPESNIQHQNILGKLLNVPGAMSRAAIQEQPGLAAASPALAGIIALTGIAGKEAQQAAGAGALRPDEVPRFQDMAIDAAQRVGGPSTSQAVNFFKGGLASAGGLAADIATDPASMLLELVTHQSAMNAVGKVANAAIPKTVKNSTKTVGDTFMRFIKPAVSGSKKAKSLRKFNENAKIAVDSIVDNKKNLKFRKLLDNGEELVTSVGDVPRSLDETAQAIEQTKVVIWDKIDELVVAAGKTRKKVDLTDIAKELRKLGNNKVNRLVDPEIQNYAIRRALDLDAMKSLSPRDAQLAISKINRNLRASHKGGTLTPDNLNRAWVDSLIKNRLNKGLNKIVKSTGKSGNEFTGLRRQYGALNEIETGVYNAVQKAAKQSKYSLTQLFDVFSAGDIIRGVAQGRADLIAKGGFQIGARLTLSKLNDPNVGITKMFKTIDKLRNPTAKSVLRDLIAQSSGALGTAPQAQQAIFKKR